MAVWICGGNGLRVAAYAIVIAVAEMAVAPVSILHADAGESSDAIVVIVDNTAVIGRAPLVARNNLTMRAAAGQRPKLSVSPTTLLIDDTAFVTIDGLRPGQPISLVAKLLAWRGTDWTSRADFVADQRGRISVATQPAVGGSYTGVDPTGLLWSMVPDSTPEDPAKMPDGDELLPHEIAFHACDSLGRAVDSATVVRRAVGSATRVTRIRTDTLVATLFESAGTGARPGVLVFGGSEGGIWYAERHAALLASHGYSALAVAYFGMGTLPKHLERIPVEYVDRALGYLASRPFVDGTRLAVMGNSRGGELALLTASRHPELRAVVS